MFFSEYREKDTAILKVVIAILSVSNLLIIVVLIVVLCLFYKELKSKRNYEFNESPKNINRREYVRQDSDTINSSFRAKITKQESVVASISENSAENVVPQTPKPIEVIDKPAISLDKINPIVQKTKVEPIIKREQMDAIMKDILSKTKRLDTHSLSDLNKLITENMEKDKKVDMTSIEIEENEQDQYDRLPTPVPLQDQIDSNNDELYDVVPNSNKLKVFNHIVSENGYSILLSSDKADFSPNDYINARRSPLKNNSDIPMSSKINNNKEDLKSPTITKKSIEENDKMKESVC